MSKRHRKTSTPREWNPDPNARGPANPAGPFKSKPDLFASSKAKRREDAKWQEVALGKRQSNRYGNRMYDKAAEAGNKLTIYPKAP